MRATIIGHFDVNLSRSWCFFFLFIIIFWIWQVLEEKLRRVGDVGCVTNQDAVGLLGELQHAKVLFSDEIAIVHHLYTLQQTMDSMYTFSQKLKKRLTTREARRKEENSCETRSIYKSLGYWSLHPKEIRTWNEPVH